MTRPYLTRLITIGITAFIPWLLLIATLGALANVPYPLFVATHWVLDVALFAVAFVLYFKGHEQETPFEVMVAAMGWLFAFDVIFFGFIYQGDLWFLNYIDWIIPVFLVATTIYLTGKAFQPKV